MANALLGDVSCDVLVIGSGAGGLSTAVTAAKHGQKVIIVEKEAVYGGTTAFSGGVLWIPGNPHCGTNDTRADAVKYMKAETGNLYQADAVETYLDSGPKMLKFFEDETAVKFIPTLYPDYHPDAPGGVEVGRSVLATPFNAAVLGKNLKRLRPPLGTITFMGMMFNSSNADIKHFFNATKSVTSFAYVTKRLIAHFLEVVRHGRGTSVTSGNALAARLAKSCFDLDIEIHTDTPAKELIIEDAAVRGALVESNGKTLRITATNGVVLAAGGFAHDIKKIQQAYPHLRRGGEHFSPVPEGNTGDGINLGTSAGGKFETHFPNTSAWMPVSKVPVGRSFKAFPHLLDRYKPGIVAVLKNGKRFTNESASYHDVGAGLIAACEGEEETACWLIADKPTIRKYGLGFAKPAPVPLGKYLSNGYLKSGKTLSDLATACGIDPVGLTTAIAEYNTDARAGNDPAFHKGATAFNRYLADPDHHPNPCVGPVEQGPYFAVKVIMGDLGTFDGLETTVQGQVLDVESQPITGLYAVGNDRASIMGGNYPGAGITLGPAMTFGYLTGRHLAGAD